MRKALLRFIQYCWNIIIEYMARFISPFSTPPADIDSDRRARLNTPLPRLVLAVTPLLMRLLTRSMSNGPRSPLLVLRKTSKLPHVFSRMEGSAPALTKVWAKVSASAWALGVISPPAAAARRSSLNVSSIGLAASSSRPRLTSSPTSIDWTSGTAAATGASGAGGAPASRTPVAGGMT